jgi:8-oxo-dGTP pyrophosphatase MutT (NUDIX family)
VLQLIFERLLGWLPAPWHRAVLRLAHKGRLAWWGWRRPLVLGCRMLASNAAGHVLLVRHSYGSGRWMLPGGGMKPAEDPVNAARREFHEEVSCLLLDARLITIIEEPLGGTTNRVHVVRGACEGLPRPDGREIVEVGFFSPAALPLPLSRGLEDLIPMWLGLE